jgi:hypothetical protein
MGLRHRHVVIIMYVITLLAAGLGMFMMIARGGDIIAILFCVILLLILVFRIVGAVKLRETLSQLRRNTAILQQARETKDIFEETYLKFHEATSFKALWQATANAAEEMGFLQLSLTATAGGGRTHKFIWRSVEAEKCRLEMVSIQLLLDAHRFGMPLEIEAKMLATNSLESTGRKMLLLGRLIDEYSITNLAVKPANTLGIKVVSKQLSQAQKQAVTIDS